MWVWQFSSLSCFHLYPVSGIVLGLLDPCGGKGNTPMKHEDQKAHYSAPQDLKPHPQNSGDLQPCIIGYYNWPRHKEKLGKHHKTLSFKWLD